MPIAWPSKTKLVYRQEQNADYKPLLFISRVIANLAFGRENVVHDSKLQGRCVVNEELFLCPAGIQGQYCCI